MSRIQTGILRCAGLFLLVVLPVEAVGQAGADRAAERILDRNGHPFRTPAGSTLEPIHRLAVLSTDRDTVRRTIALAELGDRIGFWIQRDPTGSFELAGALHGGAASRFDLAGPNQNFIEIRYRIGFLLRARLGSVAARAELFHVSSHLGDEFLTGTGAEPISTSREGIELLLQGSPLRGLTVYGGPGFLLGSSRDRDRQSLRAGLDWESAMLGDVRAYLSADAFAWSELSWKPGVSLEAGAAAGSRLRFGFLLGFGSTRAEQFLGDTETVYGASVSYVR